MKKADIIKHFSPAWFTIIMGTGSFANILYSLGKTWSPGYNLGIILASCNSILFFVFLYPWIARWFRHYGLLKKDLNHPVTGNFFVTMPLSALILGSNFALMGKPYLGASLAYLCFAAWLTGAAGAAAFGIYAVYNMVRSERITPESTNFSWLIPPVGSMAVPLAGSPLIKMLIVANPSLARDILVVNFGFFGIGLFLFLFIGGVVFNRLAVHPLPPASLTPTFWIPLGPVGVAVLSMSGLADTSKALGIIASEAPFYLSSAVVWGTGILFLGLALMVTRHNLKKGTVPFSLSWWAFVFPLSAYAMSSLRIADYFKSGLVRYYAFALITALAVLWAVTAFRTMQGTLSGELFAPNSKHSEGKAA